MSTHHPGAAPTSVAVPVNSLTRATPLLVPAHKAMAWLMGTAIVCMVIYYFLAADQGAVSVFGSNAALLHEFVHDGRHFLGFPCH